MSGTLRVATLNAWNRAGPYAQRGPLLRESLLALDADVIGLQEVEKTQLEELFAGTSYTLTWHGHGTSGMGIAARWPIAWTGAVALPGDGDQPGGIAQRALVEAHFATIPFVNATSYYPQLNQGAQRERHMPALHAAVRELRKRDRYPPILVGDLNTEPDSTEIRYLRGLQSLQGESAYYCDVWERAGEGDGATWTRRNPYSAAFGLPDRRIDYIFVGAPGVIGAGAVRTCRVVCDAPRDGVYPSDHFGVLAELAYSDG